MIKNKMLLETRIDLAKKVRDKLDEEITNIPKLTDRELLEKIYKELITYNWNKIITD